MLINYSRVIDDVQYFHKQDMKYIPKSGGVYMLFNAEYVCVYIGESGNLQARVKSSLRRTNGEFHKKATSDAEHIFILLESDETERIILEWLLVRRFAPLFNILGTDLSETQRLTVQRTTQAKYDILDLQRIAALYAEKSPENE